MHKTHNDNSGFTLVEVIVVLVILAILAAIMIPAMTGWIDRAKEKKLIVGCRTCVVAAQSIASEKYGMSDAAEVTVTPAETLALANVPGQVSGITINSAAVDQLTYTFEEQSITYYRLPSPRYELGSGGASASAWTAGTSYAKGDTIAVGNLLFTCLTDHTSTDGTGSKNTRNPDVGTGNKNAWELTGTVDGTMPTYSQFYRYPAGFEVSYKNTVSGETHVYKRKDYALATSPVPSVGNYWELVS